MSFSVQQLLVLAFLGLCSVSGPVLSQNHTLIFSKDNNIRNCSCSSDIQSCDYSLANLMCNCRTILLPKNKTVSRLSYNGQVTVWFSDLSTMDKLVNFSFVQNLRLSMCGATNLPTEYLVILGLRHLRVQWDAREEQTISISSDDQSMDGLTYRDTESPFHISYLETSAFNRLASLSSYSVENVSSILEDFPNLPFSSMFLATNNSYVVTLIYGK